MIYLLNCLFVAFSVECEAGRRIFQGRDVIIEEFPYVAIFGLLNMKGNNEFLPFCTCSVISPIWSITAAHCKQSPPVHQYYALNYGSHLPTLQGNFSKVLEVIPHPSYDSNVQIDLNVANIDISLLRTQRIHISEYAVISAVDYKTLIGQEVYVAGHGATNVSSTVDTTYALNKPLQVFKGMIIVCLKEERQLVNYPLCVSSACGSLAMICGGDSGGPMIHTSGIVGINSASLTDCQVRHHLKKIHKHSLATASSAIIAPISPALDWISRTVTLKPLI
ncbi:unnamed protein product [Colias eurytheme]|nr:unnamed protein product [Colias eurytheme]